MVEAPDGATIDAAIDRVSPRGERTYLVLDRKGGDYAQITGGKNAFTLEWRDYAGDDFRHFTAGVKDGDSHSETSIAANGAHMTIRANEKLSTQDVKAILLAFAEGHSRPADFSWRDITDMFPPSSP